MGPINNNVNGEDNIQPPAGEEVRAPAVLTRKEKFKAFMQKVWRVVKPILLGLLGAALFTINPTFFAMGFVVGVICPGNYIEDAVNRVILVWKRQSWIMVAATCVASFIALPVTMAAGCIIYSAALGNTVRRWAEQKEAREQARAAV